MQTRDLGGENTSGLSQRKGRLDPEHGGSRVRSDLSAGVLCGDTRRAQPAVDQAGSDPRNLAGLDRRPHLVTCGRDLHSGGTNVSVARCSLAKRRLATRIDRNLAHRVKPCLASAHARRSMD
jgi:hypothetical protein